MSVALRALVLVYFLLHGIVFVFHPVRGPFVALSHTMMPAAIVDGRPVWYPRVATYSRAAMEVAAAQERKDLFALGLNAAVYEAHLKNILKETQTPYVREKKEDPIEGLVRLAHAANMAVKATPEFQTDIAERLSVLRERIVDGGMPFTDAALRYSEDSSAALSGDLGVVSEDTAPEWLAPAFVMDVGEVSDVLNDVEMYWLVKVAAKEESNDTVSARLYGIAMEKKELPQIIRKRTHNQRPWMFVF